MTTRQHGSAELAEDLDKLGERVSSGRELQTLYQTDFYAWAQQAKAEQQANA